VRTTSAWLPIAMAGQLAGLAAAAPVFILQL
jgi:hypothetical protein